MIAIKIYNKKWQITIGDEVWQFEDVKEMKVVLETLIDLKDKYGQWKN